MYVHSYIKIQTQMKIKKNIIKKKIESQHPHIHINDISVKNPSHAKQTAITVLISTCHSNLNRSSHTKTYIYTDIK